MKKLGYACCIFCFSLIGNLSHAALLSIDASGELLGATGVLVSNDSYDVMFVDTPGSFANLFQKGPANVVANSYSQGRAFSDALMRQVFVNDSANFFDTQPNKISGCEISGVCQVLTPFEFSTNSVKYSIAYNKSSESSDDIRQAISSFSNNLGLRNDTVWAVWSKTPVPVPEGNLLPLFLAAILLILLTRRSKNLGAPHAN